jgi:hypothetical protein
MAQSIQDKLKEVKSLEQQRDSYHEISKATFRTNTNLKVEWGSGQGSTLLHDYHGFKDLQKLIHDFAENAMKELNAKIDEKIN